MLNVNPYTIYYLKMVYFQIYYLINYYYANYIINNNLIITKCKINKYDGIHDYYITYFDYNIKIESIIDENNNYKYIYIYVNNIILSKLYLINDLPTTFIYYIDNKKILKNPSIEIVLSLVYLDNCFFTHQLDIYNCGIIKEFNTINTTYFNYNGEYVNHNNFEL